jgi:hypothetical protein
VSLSAAYICHGARHVSPEHSWKLAITFVASPATTVRYRLCRLNPRRLCPEVNANACGITS